MQPCLGKRDGEQILVPEKKDSSILSLQSRSYNQRRRSIGRAKDNGKLKSLGEEFESQEIHLQRKFTPISRQRQNPSIEDTWESLGQSKDQDLPSNNYSLNQTDFFRARKSMSTSAALEDSNPIHSDLLKSIFGALEKNPRI